MAKESDLLLTKKLKFMIKKINISEEVVARLVKSNKCVEGSLSFSRETPKAYNRQPRIRTKDRLVKKLPWGWVKESLERIKVFGSFPKDLGTAGIMGQIDEQARDAKRAMADRELEIIEFC